MIVNRRIQIIEFQTYLDDVCDEISREWDKLSDEYGLDKENNKFFIGDTMECFKFMIDEVSFNKDDISISNIFYCLNNFDKERSIISLQIPYLDECKDCVMNVRSITVVSTEKIAVVLASHIGFRDEVINAIKVLLKSTVGEILLNRKSYLNKTREELDKIYEEESVNGERIYNNTKDLFGEDYLRKYYNDPYVKRMNDIVGLTLDDHLEAERIIHSVCFYTISNSICTDYKELMGLNKQPEGTQ